MLPITQNYSFCFPLLLHLVSVLEISSLRESVMVFCWSVQAAYNISQWKRMTYGYNNRTTDHAVHKRLYQIYSIEYKFNKILECFFLAICKQQNKQSSILLLKLDWSWVHFPKEIVYRYCKFVDHRWICIIYNMLSYIICNIWYEKWYVLEKQRAYYCLAKLMCSKK